MKSYWETYQGKKIFIIRYDHLTLEELKMEMSAAEKEVFKEPLHSVLSVVNTTGTMISPEALNLFKNIAASTKPYFLKTAVLGITGARQMMMEIVIKFSGMSMASFDDEEKAKQWLVKP